jgi:hypothetical protein
MLADWYNADERDRFLAGLRELDARCRARHGKDFADCDERDQVAVLHRVRRSRLGASACGRGEP